MALTQAERDARRREKHPEKFTADYRRNRRRRNDEKYRTTEGYKKAIRKYKYSEKCIDSTLKCKYGISLEDKKNMRAAQKGLCGICNKPMPKSLSKCFVDHNHETRKVRELVHRRCNMVLGFVEKTPKIIFACEKYLRKHDVR